MSPRILVFLGMLIGSSLGGYIPTLFGVNMISYISLVTSSIGAMIGILLGYKLSQF